MRQRTHSQLFHLASSWVAGTVLAGLMISCQISHDHGHTPPSSASVAATPAAPPPRRAAPVSSSTSHRDHDAGPAAIVPGYGHVPLEGVALPELGFTKATVERRQLARRVRTTGWVTVDETSTSHVHAKVRGYVVASHGRFAGSTVKRGDPLVSLYSEGVLAAELELLSLVQQMQSLEAADAGLSKSLNPVVDAARKRFTLWDISPGQVARVEKSGKPSRGVTLAAPRDGVVLARGAIDGMFVEPSTELFVVSDLSRLWIVFDVFEKDMPHVRVGQKATFRCEGMEVAHEATVSYLSPTIDPTTRSLRARVEVDNQGGSLRPGAFSSVELLLDAREALVVPFDAVLRTGKRDLVFVVKDGMAVPTEVVTSVGTAELVPVESGLKEGDVIVTGAQFLVDSESRLRAGSGASHAH